MTDMPTHLPPGEVDPIEDIAGDPDRDGEVVDEGPEEQSVQYVSDDEVEGLADLLLGPAPEPEPSPSPPEPEPPEAQPEAPDPSCVASLPVKAVEYRQWAIELAVESLALTHPSSTLTFDNVKERANEILRWVGAANVQ